VGRVGGEWLVGTVTYCGNKNRTVNRGERILSEIIRIEIRKIRTIKEKQ
jgi:hypothetical protein